ncbi:MAG: transporter substrate-binding domain-containing protein [Kordiimonadaceae bacterium]|nr:transporter substrate-binding domain-containing protein [Kordiimonadaceae bacterium]
MTLATVQPMPPYVNAGATEGIEIDLIKAIFARMHIKVLFEQMPDVRMVQAFERGIVTGLLKQNILANGVGCRTDWYLAHTNVGLSLASNDVKLETLADLKNYSVLAFIDAYQHLGAKFRDAVDGSPLYFEGNYQAAHVELLYKKRFDVAVGDEWILRLAQRTHFERTGKYEEIRTHSILPPALFAARFQDPALCRRFNDALAALRASGAYDALVGKYHKQIAFTEDSADPEEEGLPE